MKCKSTKMKKKTADKVIIHPFILSYVNEILISFFFIPVKRTMPRMQKKVARDFLHHNINISVFCFLLPCLHCLMRW